MAGVGLVRLGANRVLVYQYLITLVGVAAGVVFLGEGLTANMVLAGRWSSSGSTWPAGSNITRSRPS